MKVLLFLSSISTLHCPVPLQLICLLMSSGAQPGPDGIRVPTGAQYSWHCIELVDGAQNSMVKESAAFPRSKCQTIIFERGLCDVRWCIYVFKYDLPSTPLKGSPGSWTSFPCPQKLRLSDWHVGDEDVGPMAATSNCNSAAFIWTRLPVPLVNELAGNRHFVFLDSPGLVWN